ncbi:MAG: putative transporter [Bacteroidales bacterium]|nr:putative transporter [Bacteroidales bacterium]
MEWLETLFFNEGIARIILLYSLAIASGMLLGKIKIFGISPGPTFVLFTGLVIGHLGFTVNSEVSDFIREFGLILFIYSIGMQVGPGFFSTFRKGGIQLNLMAAGVVIMGVAVTISLYYLLDGRIPMPMLVGIMSGAITNTPGLGAAQEALLQAYEAGQITEIPRIALGYAAAYPLGVIGIIMSIIVIRVLFRVSLENEERKLEAEKESSYDKLEIFTLRLTNKSISGRELHDINKLIGRNFVISRLKRDNMFSVPKTNTVLLEGDVVLVVAGTADVEPITAFIGEASKTDWKVSGSALESRRIILTRSEINGKTLGSLRLRTIYGVNVTRVNRSGVDLLGSANLVLQVGDAVTVVGEIEALEKVEQFLGNILKRLNEPHIYTIFIGIFLGVIFGSIPFYIPGIPMPVKLGLAGGPLIISIIIGRFGYKFRLVTYTTQSANLMLREIGITLFLASVGIASGGQFARTVFSIDGLIWIGAGFLITTLPLVIMGIIGMKFVRLNYFTLAGLMAGSTTDPPALAYAGSIAGSDEPAISYSTVYPLTMFLRVFMAQILILLFL